MVEVGVGDENEIDVGQMMVGEAGMAEATDHQKPVGPIWIHQDISVGALNQKGGVANPSQANLPMLELGKNGGSSVAVAPFAGK